MGILEQLCRRKKLGGGERSQLNKVLTSFDLVALGVGSTLGVGVYVLPGVVSREIAGPAVILSFFYAAVASVLAGLCYAEFGAKVPKAGSAYMYSYVTIGEFVAFIIGWNLVIEYIIGGASVAKGVSVYVDSLFDKGMSNYLRNIYTIDVPFMSDYFDLFALIISVSVCVSLAVGLKESIIMNNLLTTVNCVVVIFVIVIGGMYADFMNWQIPVSKVPVDYGTGGFLPYGILGTLKGAATCFYGFVGFDVIATSGEEVINPQKAIPLSIILSLTITFIAYSGVSSVLTLMWPYFLQDVDAPIPFVFAELDLNWARWIVMIGSLFGLGASMFGALFPLPRVIYAMSQDGLLFKCLGQVHPVYKTPFVGTIVCGVITGLMSAVFNLKHLVDLMSMATLVCYTIVAMSVLILRYRIDEVEREDSESTPLLLNALTKDGSKFDLDWSPLSHATLRIYLLTLLCGLLAMFAVQMQVSSMLPEFHPHLSIGIVLVTLIMVILLSLYGKEVDSSASNTFKVPFVPITPTLSILVNLYLMCLMDLETWIHFITWIIAGLSIYFGYGLMHSEENLLARGEYKPLLDQRQV